jgi:hypothetical protein
MSIKEMEELLEATRQKIADQGRIVDARLLEKERMLEQAVIDAHLDADDNPYVFHPRSTRTAFVTPRLLEKERMLALNHITNVTLQDLLAEYKD